MPKSKCRRLCSHKRRQSPWAQTRGCCSPRQTLVGGGDSSGIGGWLRSTVGAWRTAVPTARVVTHPCVAARWTRPGAIRPTALAVCHPSAGTLAAAAPMMRSAAALNAMTRESLRMTDLAPAISHGQEAPASRHEGLAAGRASAAARSNSKCSTGRKRRISRPLTRCQTPRLVTPRLVVKAGCSRASGWGSPAACP
jgi:hypothetical protein